MKKVFAILRVGEVDQQRLAVFNLTGSAQEWWKSVSTEAGQNTVEWSEFERRFDLMFMPETSMIAKSYELEKLEQGNMIVNEYEQRFWELCQYTPHMDTETRRCRLFEKGLHEEIRTPVAASMFNSYARCVESARSVEMTTPKAKTEGDTDF